MAAITENARKQADELEGVTLKLAEGVTDTAAQADQIETLIAGKPDALVVLPNEGEALTPVALKAMEAGIPVVNVDREFSEDGAYRTLITGDNYGIGYQAGNYFADERSARATSWRSRASPASRSPSSAHRASRTPARCEGSIKIVASQPADFLPDKGLTVMENILQAQDSIDAVYTHDDDMAEGVVAASRTPAARGDVPDRRRRLEGRDGADQGRRSTARPSSTTPRCRPRDQPRASDRPGSGMRISPSRRCPPRSRWPPPR